MAKEDVFIFKFVEINLNRSCLKGNIESSIAQSSLMSWLGVYSSVWLFNYSAAVVAKMTVDSVAHIIRVWF